MLLVVTYYADLYTRSYAHLVVVVRLPSYLALK
jgi:hypothetical protein